MRRALAALVLACAFPAYSDSSCVSSERSSSLGEIVARVHAGEVKYVFVGERHGVGPVKKFAVDLANALVESGEDVGLYVEGFRTDCPPRDGSCWSLARAFNGEAFRTLLDESKASIHPIDPPERDRRTARMAARIAKGREAVRVVLVGKSHVVYAGDHEAEHWVYGGGLRFPDPGDLAEAFPRQEVLTIGLETSEEGVPSYALRLGGCGVDYVVTTEPTRDYWGTVESTGIAKNEGPAATSLR